jgi:hypothetical protein
MMQKARRLAGFFFAVAAPRLFQFRFLVHDVFAGDGIEFLDLHLFRHELLVLGRRVEVAGTGRRFELDFFAGHDRDSWKSV